MVVLLVFVVDHDQAAICELDAHRLQAQPLARRELVERLLFQEAPWIFIVWRPQAEAGRSALKGYVRMPGGLGAFSVGYLNRLWIEHVPKLTLFYAPNYSIYVKELQGEQPNLMGKINPVTWYALGTIAGGEVVSADSY